MMIHCCKIQSQSITVYSTIDIIEEVDEGMEDDTKLRDADIGEMLIVLRVTAVVVHNNTNSHGVVVHCGCEDEQRWYCTDCGGTDHGTWGIHH